MELGASRDPFSAGIRRILGLAGSIPNRLLQNASRQRNTRATTDVSAASLSAASLSAASVPAAGVSAASVQTGRPEQQLQLRPEPRPASTAFTASSLHRL